MTEIIIPVSLGMITVIYTMLFVRILARERLARERVGKTKDIFYRELERRITLGVIETIGDIALVQQSIAVQEKYRSFAEEELASLLEGYLLKVTEKGRFRFIKSLIDLERKEKPFSVLPGKEREIADKLNRAIEDGQTDFALNQLNELVVSLGAKLQAAQDELSSTRTWSRRGAYGTIAGLILTIVVGLVVGLLR